MKYVIILLLAAASFSCKKDKYCTYVAQKRIVFDLTTNGFAYTYIMVDGKKLVTHVNYEVGDKICF